jgi:hypothetical protein
LLNIFTATFHIWRLFLHPQSEDMRLRGDRDRSFMATENDEKNYRKMWISVICIGIERALSER